MLVLKYSIGQYATNGVKLDTKTIALTIVFAALAIALNPVVVPAVYLVGIYYRFWEIPIVIAFLLLGPKSGVAVALLRALAELTLFPGPVGYLGPLITLPPTLGTLLGIYLAERFLKGKASLDQISGRKVVTYITVLGALCRTVFVPVVMYPVYRFLLPRALSDVQIMAIMPPLIIFSLTLAAYTIPIGYMIARTVSRHLAVGAKL